MKIRLLLVFLVYLVLSPAVRAVPPDSVIEQQSEQLLREQQRQLMMEERERNLEELERSLTPIEPPTPRPVPEKEAPQPCFDITRIELRGADNLFEFEKQALIEPYLNRCLTAQDIDKLRVDIDRYYIEQGWILTRAYLLPGQNLKEGVLIFKVLEGKIDRIKLNDNSLGDRLQAYMAFPGMQDEVAYIRDIEQGLEQINRLASNRATVDIVPAKDKPGYGNILVTNKPRNRFRYYAGYHNLGAQSTGQEQGSLTADVDNLLYLNDNWRLSASEYTGNDTDQQDSDSVSLNLGIPYGYWILQLNSARSTYLTTIRDTSGDFRLSGDATTHKLAASRVVHRDKYSKTSLGVDLTHKDNNTFLEDVRLDTSSRKLTIITLDARHMSRRPGKLWLFNLSYSRGMDLFDAVRDGPVRDDNVPRGQFERWGVDVSTVLDMDWLGNDWSYRGILAGQYSRDPLFGSEQISLGDSGSVRGFRNSPVAGDSGIYLRNDLVWQPAPDSRWLKGLRLSLGVDGGLVRAKNDNIANSGEGDAVLTGLALGVQHSLGWARHQHLSWSATWAVPLSHPDYIQTDSSVFYAQLNWKWW